jgi:alkylation response protein AidB-like acyl-CoA dehydrogenase
VKLRFDDSVEAFRAELLAWVAANRPSAEEMAADPFVSTGHAPDWSRRWTRRLFDAGLLVPGWPPEWGGRNLGAVETLVYMEELAKAGLPRTGNVQGLGIIAPSIIDYGTPEQVEQFALPILRGEQTACLGMSEPGAGSDLAALSTRAVLEGDDWVLNGQKVWTSGANHADFCFLFCRTDPDAPKHKGISIVLVPMDTPGITVRPLPEIVHPDHPDLNEVFLDDVRVPAANLVGELNNGWAMANGSLAHERGMVWLSAVMGLQRALAALLDQAPGLLDELPPTERALTVDEIVKIAIDAEAARCLGYRGFAKLVRGGTAPEQALMKVYASEARQRIGQIGAEVEGADGATVGRAAIEGGLAIDEPQGTWLEQYFQSFANTISAGASEIQRNIIAERVLGLPRG